MKAKTIVGIMLVAILALVSMLSAVTAEETPVAAGTNESVMVTLDEAVNVSMSVTTAMAEEDGMLSFPREGDTLFPEEGYLIWETDSPLGNDYKISVGIIPAGMEVNSSNAKWVVIRANALDGYFTWYPPVEIRDGKYNAIVLVDYETAGMGRGTYNQETFTTEGPFFLIDPYDPLDDLPDSPR